MAAQSMLMGDAFGKSYQYGKRKISAMTNEEFNALTPEDLAKDITADFDVIIPEMKISMEKSREFQSLIIQELGEIVKSIPQELRNFIFGNDPNAANTFGSPDLQPSTTPGSIYDYIGKGFDSAFTPKLLSTIGITTASSFYLTLKGHVDNFLAGVGLMNQRIIDDAIQNAKDFLATLNLDQFDTPTPTTPTTPPPDVPTTDEQRELKLPLAFLETLNLSDFKTGGHRTRATSFGLLEWTVPFQVVWASNITWENHWELPGSWEATRSHSQTTELQAVAIVNKLKVATGANYVKEFIISGSRTEWYLIHDGHV